MPEIPYDTPAATPATPTPPADDVSTGDTSAATPTATPEASDAPSDEQDPVIAKAEKLAQQIAQKRNAQVQYELRQARRAADEAQRVAAQAAAEREAARRELEDLRRLSGMPRPEQYNMDAEQYRQAMESYYRQDREARDKAEAERRTAAERMQLQAHIDSRIQQRLAEGTQKFPDFVEAVTNPALPALGQMNPLLWAALLEHERGVEASYFLAKNPSELYRLAQLPPARASTELGLLIAKLPSDEQRRQASTAPAPPATVGGNERAAPKSPSQMSDAEFAAWRRKQIQARGR